MNLKKPLSLLLSAALALSLAAPALAAEASAPWYAEAQAYVEEKGLMSGTPNGFEPEVIVTRATVFQTLWNMEGKPVSGNAAFPDAEGKWYADSAAWAYDSGLTVGDGTGAFAGDRSVTRAEIVTIFHRYAQFKGADLSVGEDTNILSYTDAQAVAEWAVPSFQWACGAGILSGKDGGRLDPAGTATRAELATILMNCRTLSPKQVTLEEYLESAEEPWFLTGKTSYTVQGMMVSKETSFHNPLEVTDYTVTDDGVSVVLKGTVGEQWVTKLEKVMKTYTKADGTPVTAEDFAGKDVFIDLKTKASPESNFAMFVPKGTSVTVNTAWGDVLHTNLFNAPHGDGDYLVCPNKDGQPDLSDVWVVNGAVFPTTYDRSRQPVTGTVTSVSKYGHVTTDLAVADLEARGYEVGDILSITVDGQTLLAPYGTGYSNVDNGQVIALPDKSTSTLSVAINMGNFASTYNTPEGTVITFSMGEKAGYLEEYTIRNIDALRTNDRADYADDATFANFRAVTVGGISEGRLYRTSSPVNPELGRNTYADALAKEAGVKTVLNLADDEQTMQGYEGYAESYYATLNVKPLNMGVDFAAEDFNAKLKEGLMFLTENEGPYLIHCNEGKDRAGFVSALLEALCGADLGEIVEDYMLSFENYYHVEYHSDRWTRIAQSNIIKTLCSISGVDSEEALDGVDLQAAAETYLTGTVGLSAETVAALRTALTE